MQRDGDGLAKYFVYLESLCIHAVRLRKYFKCVGCFCANTDIFMIFYIGENVICNDNRLFVTNCCI